MDSVLGILWLIWTIVFFVLYHTVFVVYYFDLGRGVLKELIGSAIIGAIMAALTLYLWWVTAIIVILVGVGNTAKSGSKAHIVIAIVFAIAIAVIHFMGYF
jgi:hypothetical protein